MKNLYVLLAATTLLVSCGGKTEVEETTTTPESVLVVIDSTTSADTVNGVVVEIPAINADSVLATVPKARIDSLRAKARAKLDSIKAATVDTIK